jgi:hypothetical protein
VQGAEHQVPRLGGLDGDGHGLEVAHLAHEHHVGVFAQGGAQGVAEKPSVCTRTSRWLMRQRLLGCTNSMGSSMVMM